MKWAKRATSPCQDPPMSGPCQVQFSSSSQPSDMHFEQASTCSKTKSPGQKSSPLLFFSSSDSFLILRLLLLKGPFTLSIEGIVLHRGTEYTIRPSTHPQLTLVSKHHIHPESQIPIPIPIPRSHMRIADLIMWGKLHCERHRASIQEQEEIRWLSALSVITIDQGQRSFLI